MAEPSRHYDAYSSYRKTLTISHSMSNQSQNDPTNISEIKEGLAKLAKSTNQTPPGDGVTMLTVSMSQPLSRSAHEIGQILADSPLYRFGDGFVTIDKASGEFQSMTPNRFCSWVEGYLFTTLARRAGEEIITMKRDYAAQVMASDNFRLQIREIKAVNTVRLPVWRGTGEVKANRSKPFWLVEGSDWHVELLPPGYDERTKTFTIELVPFDDDMSKEEAEYFLHDVLKSFPWVREEEHGTARTLGVHLAAMLGTFCRSMFKDGTVRPMIIYNGNQPGSGKSLLMRMALAPVYGAPAEDSKPGNEELRKKLDIAAMDRKPYLVLDDVSSLHSHDLNRFTSSPVHEARVLGQSRNMVCENVTQVFATGNQLTLAEDLVRRSLVVDLFEPSKATERDFEKELTPDWLFMPETRARFLATLWSIVRDWNDAERPHDSNVKHTSAPVWASVIGSIVNHFNPKLKPFAKRIFEIGGDESGAALEALLIAIASDVPAEGEEFKNSELIELAESKGLLEAIAGHCKDPRKALGHCIKRMRGRQFTDAHGRRFEFGKRDKSFGAVYPIRFIGA